jgi:hypothetical protein
MRRSRRLCPFVAYRAALVTGHGGIGEDEAASGDCCRLLTRGTIAGASHYLFVCLCVCVWGECSATNGRGERISGQTVVRRDLGRLDCVFIGAIPDATSTYATRHGTLFVVRVGSEKEERGGVVAIANNGPATWHGAAVVTMTFVNKSDAAVSGRRVCERGQVQPAASCIAR